MGELPGVMVMLYWAETLSYTTVPIFQNQLNGVLKIGTFYLREEQTNTKFKLIIYMPKCFNVQCCNA